MSAPLDPDRYAYLKLKLQCPRCASTGMIPWQQLDRVLWCRNCGSLYRVEPAGLVEFVPPQQERIEVQVRSNLSDWQGHEAIIVHKPILKHRIRRGVLRLAASRVVQLGLGTCAIAIILASWIVVTRPPEPPERFELPTLLDDRAVLLTEALARRDYGVLILLTDPTQHRALRIWLAHGTDVPKKSSDAGTAPKAELLKKSVSAARGNHASARVRIRVRWGTDAFVHEQQWVQMDKGWYFQPTRLRMTRSPSTAPPLPPRGMRRKL